MTDLEHAWPVLSGKELPGAPRLDQRSTGPSRASLDESELLYEKGHFLQSHTRPELSQEHSI